MAYGAVDDQSSFTREVNGVERALFPFEILGPIDCQVFVSREEYIESMPHGIRLGGKVTVHFFQPKCILTDEDLAREYGQRRLDPSDPYSLAAVIRQEPAFIDAFPCATHWNIEDEDRSWASIAFSCWHGVRSALVRKRALEEHWDPYWWFAGVPTRNRSNSIY